MTTQQFLDIRDKMPPEVSIDETSFYHGDFQHAYGHTADMLIYWTNKGKAMTSRRDPSQSFINLHDELFRGYYEDNSAYDFDRLIAEGTPRPQQKREPQQLTLWAD